MLLGHPAIVNLCLYALMNRATTANIQLPLCTYFKHTQTHSLYVYSMTYHDWSLQTLQAALVIKIVHQNSVHQLVQVSFKVNFTCQWWSTCRWKESNERRMSRNTRHDGAEGYIITSTILNLLRSSHFLFSSPIVLAQINSCATLGAALNQRGDY